MGYWWGYADKDPASRDPSKDAIYGHDLVLFGEPDTTKSEFGEMLREEAARRGLIVAPQWAASEAPAE